MYLFTGVSIPMGVYICQSTRPRGFQNKKSFCRAKTFFILKEIPSFKFLVISQVISRFGMFLSHTREMFDNFRKIGDRFFRIAMLNPLPNAVTEMTF